MENIELDEVIQPKKRPTFLKVLCILTYISTGLALLGVFAFIGKGKWTEQDYSQNEIEHAKVMSQLEEADMGDFWFEVMESSHQVEIDIQENFYIYVIFSLLTALIGLFGAIFMWQGKKLGFHLYIIYSLLSVASVYSYTSAENVPSSTLIIGLLFAGLFVFMYSRNLKWMTK